jgi:hypothetical protein
MLRREEELTVATIESPLIGAWRLVSYQTNTDNAPDGRPYGAQPLGTLLYTADGYMGAQLFQVDSVKAGAVPRVQSFSAVFTMTATGFSFVIKCANNPAVIGTTQVRTFTIAGDPQILCIEWTDQGVHNRVRWQRVSGGAVK